MNIRRLSKCGTACLLATLFLGGCGSSKPVRYFTLEPTLPRTGSDDAENIGVVGITQVGMPEYLDRPQIITRGSGNRLILADFDRWAEPLSEGTARVLAADLSSLLPGFQIRHRGWLDKSRLDYAVGVEVTRFEGVAGGDVTLSATWSVIQKGETQGGPSHQSEFEVAAGGRTMDDLARAMSEGIGKLAQDIAEHIRLSGHKP